MTTTSSPPPIGSSTRKPSDLMSGLSTRPPSSRSDLSAVEFWANWIVAALWFGDGYLYVPVRDEAGAPKPPSVAAPPVRRPDPRWHLLGERCSPTRRDGRPPPRSGPLLERSRPRGHHRTWCRPRPGRHPPHLCDRGVQHGSPGRLFEVDPTQHERRTGPSVEGDLARRNTADAKTVDRRAQRHHRLHSDLDLARSTPSWTPPGKPHSAMWLSPSACPPTCSASPATPPPMRTSNPG